MAFIRLYLSRSIAFFAVDLIGGMLLLQLLYRAVIASHTHPPPCCIPPPPSNAVSDSSKEKKEDELAERECATTRALFRVARFSPHINKGTVAHNR